MLAILVCLGLIGLGVTIAERSKDWDQCVVFAPLFFGVIGTLVWVIVTQMVYTAQADDVATVRGQQAIVAICAWLEHYMVENGIPSHGPVDNWTDNA